MRLLKLIVALRVLKLSRLFASSGIKLVYASTHLALFAKAVIDDAGD
jgi:hypothetical protein